MRAPFSPVQPHSNYIPRVTPKPTDGKKTESTIVVPSYDPYTNSITTNNVGGGSGSGQYKSTSPSSSSRSSSSTSASAFGGSMFSHTTIANSNGRVPPVPTAPLHALAGGATNTSCPTNTPPCHQSFYKLFPLIFLFAIVSTLSLTLYDNPI